MTVLQTIAVDGVPPQPWRNGGGRTRALWTWPGGEAPWQLRLSVADIDADSPFSAFDGIDRWFAVLQGAGVRLALPDGPQALTQHSPPLHFAGEAAPGCWLTDGPTRDFNLMLRRGSGQAAMLDGQCRGRPGSTRRHMAWRCMTTTAVATADRRPAGAGGSMPWTLGCCPRAPQRASAGCSRRPPARLPAGQRACWLAFTPQPSPAHDHDHHPLA